MKRIIRTLLSLILAACLLSASAALGDGLTIYPAKIETQPGTSVPLYVSPSDGVVWESTNPAIVSIDGGIVAAHAPGEAIISANRGGETVSCHVVVLGHHRTIGIPNETAARERSGRQNPPCFAT